MVSTILKTSLTVLLHTKSWKSVRYVPEIPKDVLMLRDHNSETGNLNKRVLSLYMHTRPVPADWAPVRGKARSTEASEQIQDFV